MTMEMIEIQAFIEIAQVGSFTGAARTLHISQPAVSRRIELLEQELGAPLFERMHAGVRLTDAGEAFLPYARQVLAAVRDGESAVQALESGRQGTVTLALVGTLASTDLSQRLRLFRDAHPEVQIRLRTARSDEVSVLVQQGEAALGLRYFSDPSSAVISLPVQEEDLVVVCAGDSRRVDPAVTYTGELAGVPWIGFPIGTGSSGEPFARVLEQQLLRAGLGQVEHITIDSLTAQKRLIEADFGVGLLPASSIDEELRLGTLRVLEVDALRTTIPVMAIHRRGGYLDSAARHLLSALLPDNTPEERG